MNADEIVKLKFPDFCKPGIIETQGQRINGVESVFISVWNVPGIPLPDEATLAQWEQDCMTLKAAEDVRRAFIERNILVLQQLDDVDTKSVRALRSNDTARLAELEARAVELRQQLV